MKRHKVQWNKGTPLEAHTFVTMIHFHYLIIIIKKTKNIKTILILLLLLLLLLPGVHSKVELEPSEVYKEETN